MSQKIVAAFNISTDRLYFIKSKHYIKSKLYFGDFRQLYDGLIDLYPPVIYVISGFFPVKFMNCNHLLSIAHR